MTNIYQKHKEKLRKVARERYQNLSEEKIDKRRHYYRKPNKNLSKQQKQKLVVYRRNYYIMHNK